MAAKSLADRVAALETKVGKTSIEEQFREQAELIDRRFTDEFREQAELIDRRFTGEFREQAELIDRRFTDEFREQAELIDRRFTDEFRQQAELIDRLFAYRFEELDKKWSPRFANIEKDVSSLQKDMAIVREGIGILLKRRPQ